MPASLNTIIEALAKNRIIGLFTLSDSDIAADLANALYRGGINILEVTFRTQAGLIALKNIKKLNLPILVGAGTIRTIDQAQNAVEAGADFFVTPGYNPKIIKWAQDHQVPIIPGVDSTIAIEQAVDAGLSTLKFFPADIGGIKWLKAINGPYSDIKFITTGGISLANLKEFLTQPNVLAVAGTFLCPSDAIKQKNFDQITEICKSAKKIIESLNSA